MMSKNITDEMYNKCVCPSFLEKLYTEERIDTVTLDHCYVCDKSIRYEPRIKSKKKYKNKKGGFENLKSDKDLTINKDDRFQDILYSLCDDELIDFDRSGNMPDVVHIYLGNTVESFSTLHLSVDEKDTTYVANIIPIYNRNGCLTKIYINPYDKNASYTMYSNPIAKLEYMAMRPVVARSSKQK